MNRRKKLLYIMGIDWNWIYQRPQILAEKLSRDYDVTVLFPRSILRLARLPRPKVPGIAFRILRTLPFQEKNFIIGFFSRCMNAAVLRGTEEFDLIYIGYPVYARYVPFEFRGKVIYDCMDNHELLYPDRKRVEKVLKQEKRLIQSCNLLLVSSLWLKEKADMLAGRKKSILVRNAPGIETFYPPKDSGKKDHYILCYIGTIAEWFDYGLLAYSLKSCSNIEYRLIGPCQNRKEMSGISFSGVLSHEELGTAAREMDCLIMPFVLTPLVEAVDPVKLYEYIALGKCIVSVYYPEIERFKEFVYFYRTKEEYVFLLKNLSDRGFVPKYDRKMQEEFLAENTWEKRYQTLQEQMGALEEQIESEKSESHKHIRDKAGSHKNVSSDQRTGTA